MKFAFTLGSRYMYIVQFILLLISVFALTSLPPPLNLLSLFSLLLLFISCLWHTMCPFINSIHSSIWHVLVFLICSVSAPSLHFQSPGLLGICKRFIFLFLSNCIILFIFTYSNERYLFNLACLIYFTPCFIFQVCLFPYKCLQFILFYSWVVVCYIKMTQF